MATILNKNSILLLFGMLVSLFVVIKLVPGKAATRNIVRTTTTETFSKPLYRGVCERHIFYAEAEKGIAKPFGGHNDPIRHRNGNNESVYTSWTTDFRVAFEYATTDEFGNKCDGLILIALNLPTYRLTDISGKADGDIFREKEFLIKDIINGCVVIPVNRNDNWQKINFDLRSKGY
jgi:hypothetical protein